MTVGEEAAVEHRQTQDAVESSVAHIEAQLRQCPGLTAANVDADAAPVCRAIAAGNKVHDVQRGR